MKSWLSRKRSDVQGAKYLYLSGPMTGYPEYNYPEFNRLAVKLRARGIVVYNPAELPAGPWLFCMARDLSWIMWKWATGRYDGIALHGAWWRSRGARIELALTVLLRRGVWMAEDLA